MRYLGGKQRILKHLVPIIQAELASPSAKLYCEPFIGGGSVFCAVTTDKPKFGHDANAYLVALWQYLQANGPEGLPEVVDEGEYARLKNGGGPDWLRAFVGFGSSFGGKWFGGYARDPKSDRNYTLGSKNSLARRCGAIKATDSFSACSYADLAISSGGVYYCDPPYANTTGYGAVGLFDSSAFWDWCREVAQSNVVLVSEYAAPSDVACVAEITTKTDMGGKTKHPRIERLYRLGTLAQ